MYERRSARLLTRAQFLERVAKHALVAAAVLAASLGLGVLGYHCFEGIPWLDALLNVSMILGGMGPVDTLRSTGGKLFASFYALFSGVIFLAAAWILFAPIVHRLLHQFHLDVADTDRSAQIEPDSSPVRAQGTADPISRPPAGRD
jgi:hypothetical protein